MALQIADYVLIALAVGLVVLGLFRGFSGTLAFFAALIAAVVAARLGWEHAGVHLDQIWVRVLAVSTGALLIFGLVRLFVSRFVHCLLAQPTDAILGALAGLAGFLLFVYVWAYLAVRVASDWPFLKDCSFLIRLVVPYVG